jgi:hypothetical protein
LLRFNIILHLITQTSTDLLVSSGVLALCFALAPGMSLVADKSIQFPVVCDAEVGKAGFLNQTGLGAEK